MATETSLAETVTGYTPTAEDLASVEEWFRRYDRLAAVPDVEGMAGVGMFPMNLVTDDSAGDGYAEQWDRERYASVMAEVMGGDHGDVQMESTRTPFFLSGQLVVVFTRATFRIGEQAHEMNYADILVRVGGEWYFQTMVQAGWGDMMKATKAR